MGDKDILFGILIFFTKDEKGRKTVKPWNLFKKAAILALAFGLMMGMTKPVCAGGTHSGIQIGNMATVDYKMNDISQTPIESSPDGNSTPGIDGGESTTFVVDNKVNMTVITQDTAPVLVTPGGIGYYLTFLITNTGNTTQDYALSVNAVIQGGETKFNNQLDAFDMNNVRIRVDDGDGQYNDANDTADFIDELAPDANILVFIDANAPLTTKNGEYASYHLIATTHNGGALGLGALTEETEGADNADSVDIVFADANGTYDRRGDGQFSDQGDYKCVSSALIIIKTSEVISDPINGNLAPKRIPGAVIEYVTNIKNAPGAGAAADIQVSESLDYEITEGAITFDPDGYAEGYGIELTDSAGTITLTTLKDDEETGGDQGDFGGISGDNNTVTVTGISLDGGESAIIKFRVIIR